MMNMKDMSVTAFSELTASSSAAPGGGSISAMAGAYAAALCGMVAKLTIPKQGYEDTIPQMEEIERGSEALRLELLEDIQKDSESFNAYMEALTLPKGSEEEKALRRQAMQEALKGACRVPLHVAGKCLRVLEMASIAVARGNINTASDAMVAVLLGRASVLGAVNNVLINLGGIKDEAFVEEMRAACRKLENKANQVEQAAQATLHAR